MTHSRTSNHHYLLCPLCSLLASVLPYHRCLKLEQVDSGIEFIFILSYEKSVAAMHTDHANISGCIIFRDIKTQAIMLHVAVVRRAVILDDACLVISAPSFAQFECPN